MRVRQQFSFAYTCTVGAGAACDLFFCIDTAGDEAWRK
ncbi:hypothetical protein PG5_43760 [Pseudomonas sp. G5(2012)]|nr:hypothetical protein PG5_43760 [Pseudomonas sp. G5(2012)]